MFYFFCPLIRCSFSPLTIQEKRKPREQGSGRGLDPSPILAGRARRLRRPYDLCRGRAVALRPLDKVVARLWVGGQGRRRGGGVNFFDGTGAGNRRVVFGELLVCLFRFYAAALTPSPCLPRFSLMQQQPGLSAVEGLFAKVRLPQPHGPNRGRRMLWRRGTLWRRSHQRPWPWPSPGGSTAAFRRPGVLRGPSCASGMLRRRSRQRPRRRRSHGDPGARPRP